VKRRLIVRVEAEQELAEAAEWYERKRPRLGRELIDVVQEALNAIMDAPEVHALWKAGYPYRKHVLRRFPFVVFFAVEGSSIHVVAFAHSKRRPVYWLRRLPR
jgi:toxin ParE1/3/4